MKSMLVLTLAVLASASTAIAASRSSKRCFIEPFPLLLQNHITNEQQCGLNNPHIVNFVCEPIRGLVPDAEWLSFQLSQFEEEVVREDEQAYVMREEDAEAIFQQNLMAGDVFALDAAPSARPVRQEIEQVELDYKSAGMGAIALGMLGMGTSKL